MTDHRLAVIVLAAGQGTRMKSSRPKVLHTLAGRSLIGHVLATAQELQPQHLITVVRHERDAVVTTIGELAPGAIVVDQDEIPGTGRAVEIAIAALPEAFDGDVVVVSGDVPLLDDGYHDVASAYQAVSLYEDVRATRADDFAVTVKGSVDVSGVPTDGSNIAIKAARALARRTGYRGGAHIAIEKHVPVAGGMGGGSADAAATLLACDALWGTALPREELLALASELGADVPFALTGGTAIGTGRGDQLSPALAKGQFQWVLAIAGFGLSTAQVYSELDRHRERHAQDIFPVSSAPSVDANVLQALRAGDPHMLAESLHNDLQAPALYLQPSLTRILELGDENGALAGIVSGSGPTIAFLAADLDSALELQIALSAARLEVVRATGPVHGARVVGD